jgi:hypothetical protein
VAGGHQHAGLQAFLAKGVRRFNDGAFIVAELFVQQKGVIPLESGLHGAS